MSQPSQYTLQTDFSDSEKNGVPVSGTKLDNELTQIQISLNHAIDNLGLIQRDDSKLKNESVTKDTLDPVLQGVIDNVENIANGSLPDATETIKGGVMIASTEDVNTGTNDTKAVTPAKLKAKTDSITSYVDSSVAAVSSNVSSLSASTSTQITNLQNNRQLKNVLSAKSEFPATGDVNTLYIDTENHDVYYWNDQYLKLADYDGLVNQIYDNKTNITQNLNNITSLGATVQTNTINIAKNTAKGQETVLWSGGAGSGTITLSNDINNYKYLMFRYGTVAAITYLNIPVSEFKTTTSSIQIRATVNTSTPRWVIFHYVNETSLIITSSGGSAILQKVIGIK
ncbi:MAG: hypothetical protein GY793_08565 [Proteobacteria bacterium]|nr:hypothetical protein [Pseudomonadota bacterium]